MYSSSTSKDLLNKKTITFNFRTMHESIFVILLCTERVRIHFYSIFHTNFKKWKYIISMFFFAVS